MPLGRDGKGRIVGQPPQRQFRRIEGGPADVGRGSAVISNR